MHIYMVIELGDNTSTNKTDTGARKTSIFRLNQELSRNEYEYEFEYEYEYEYEYENEYQQLLR